MIQEVEVIPVERQLTHAIPKDLDEVDIQLAVETRWSMGMMVFYFILFLACLVGAMVAGLLYRAWV